ncbi:MAG: alkaline phosphatase family protein [Acidobacteria bacterium]|nr:alkaline phosphatase family protein [Acidobacteriota bacterium]
MLRKILNAKIVLQSAVLLLFFTAASAQNKISDLDETVILISVDGFRADYIEKFQPPVISRLAAEGTRAKWMKPAYPTKTFPNHYTIVTGLYPDNHGIIENNMWDDEIAAVFGLSVREQVTNPKWWSGEPIWNTAQRQGKIAASFFWPGSEAAIKGSHPRYWKPYEHTTAHSIRVRTVLEWIDLPREQRPQMLTLYFSDVDDAGHNFGPDSPKTGEAVMKVDASIGDLVSGLRSRGIDEKVNLIIVSDHGMAPYRVGERIVLDKLFDANDAVLVLWNGEFTQIFPKAGREDTIYKTLKKNLPKGAKVYRKGDLPKRLKFGKNKRIAPIIVAAQIGYGLATTRWAESATKAGENDLIRGGHGYDNEAKEMRAIFIGHGGKFKKGYLAEPIESVDVYGLMCRILEIQPAKNDGKFKRVRKMLK